MKKVAGIVLSSLYVFLMPLGFACGDGEHGQGDKMMLHAVDPGNEFAQTLAYPMSKLDLSDDQKKQRKQILLEARPTIQALNKQLNENHDKLRAAFENGASNDKNIKNLADKQGQLTSQLLIAQATTQNRLYQVLTPTQRAKIATLKQE